MRLVFSLSFFVLCCALSVTAQQGEAVLEPHRWHNSPVNSEVTNQRLSEFAAHPELKGPVPRMAIFDIGYPRSLEEFTKLDGNSILMVTSLSHTQNAFPFKRVYAKVGPEIHELKVIRQVLSRSEADPKVAKVFGRYRSDGLYLLPFYIRLQTGASIWADFSNSEKPMQIAAFNTPVGESVAFLPDRKPTGKGPDADFLEVYLRREYPAFFEKKQ